MEPLFHTLEIDSADPAKQDEFLSLINDNAFVVFIVLGNTTAIENIVLQADYAADGFQGTHARKVVWVKDSTFLEADCLAHLKTFKNFGETDFDKVIAFTLSPIWHETKFIFMREDRTQVPRVNCVYYKRGRLVVNQVVRVGSVDVDYAYWKASLPERRMNSGNIFM